METRVSILIKFVNTQWLTNANIEKADAVLDLQLSIKYFLSIFCQYWRLILPLLSSECLYHSMGNKSSKWHLIKGYSSCFYGGQCSKFPHGYLSFRMMVLLFLLQLEDPMRMREDQKKQNQGHLAWRLSPMVSTHVLTMQVACKALTYAQILTLLLSSLKFGSVHASEGWMY